MIRVFVIAGLVAAAAPAAADLIVVSKHTKDGKSGTSTSYFGGDRVRLAMAGGNEVIADLTKGEYTFIDNEKQQYSVVTRQDIEAAAAQMKEAQAKSQAQMKQMEEQMKSMPPAMRDKMKGMMGGLAATVDVKKGASRKVAGYGCDTWVISVGSLSKTESCLSTEVPVPVPAQRSLDDFKATFEAMGPAGQYFSELQEKTKDMKGFTLASTTSVSVFGKSSTETMEVTEIKKGALPATAFDIPSGYKKKDSPFKSMKKK